MDTEALLKKVSSICLALPEATVEHEDLVRRSPKRFYLPAYIGVRGWAGLRLDTGKIDWEEVSGLVSGSYRLVAPKKLAAGQKIS